MQVKKTEKQTKEVNVVVESYTLCDKCNEKIVKDAYDAFDFTFEHKTGTSYPEGGSGEQDEMDLCDKCSKELVEFLRAKGYRITTKEWDW